MSRPLRAAIVALAIAPCMDARAEPLLVGTASADITPPLEVGLLMSSSRQLWAPFEGKRLPLEARCLIVQKGNIRVALVSLDLIGLADEAVGGMRRFRDRIAAAASNAVSSDELILACSHTHSAPESIDLTALRETPAFREWIKGIATNVGRAIGGAVHRLRPCRLITGVGPAPDMAVNRRIETTKGIASSRQQLPPETVIGPEGPVDELVRVAGFVGPDDRMAAIVVNFTAHPVLEMCIPQISPDYPGETRAALEGAHPGAAVLFLQGAAGNINPPTMERSAANAHDYGGRLARHADAVLAKCAPAFADRVSLRWKTALLPTRETGPDGTEKTLDARIGALVIGDAAFVFLPGEPFVEIADAIRAASPYRFTAVVGYADDYIGYIPTDRAFENGGYETREGRWSRLKAGAADVVQRAATELMSKP